MKADWREMTAPLDIGESLVGAYLRYVAGCDFVVYGTQTEQQGEIDVIGFEITARRVRLCEVATHLDGLLYGNGNADTAKKIRQKTERAAKFAASMFDGQEAVIEWWSPKASPVLVGLLEQIQGEHRAEGMQLEFVVNETYSARVCELMTVAARATSPTPEPFFRALQILTHLPGRPIGWA
jgi:hypothetical protein